jgi:maltose 6'-phosphate phosphatase
MEFIRFVYVKNVIARTVHGTFQELEFAVQVANVGFGKRVDIHWRGEDGVWQVTPAEFRCALPDGMEVWVAESVWPLRREVSIPGNIQFAACLEQDGVRHWDSRFGQNYRVDADSGVLVLEPVAARVAGCRPWLADGLVSLPLEVAVRREMGAEAVAVHWSVDGWATTQVAQAYFRRDHWDRSVGSNARNPNRYGWEIWATRLPVQRAYRVEFAVECRTKHGTFWDNHSGFNYRVERRKFRAMTLNLHTYQEEEQAQKFAQVARAIQELGIDVVCLQEVGENWNDGAGDWESNAARIINSHLPQPYHLHADWSHLGFERYREGLAILSRHPFVFTDAGYVSASEDPFDIHARKVVMAQVKVPYVGAVNVFSVHLSWPSGGFYEQFERLRQWAEARQGPEVAATLIAGDFNVAVGSEAYRHMVDTRQFEDQFLKIQNSDAFQQVFRRRQDGALRQLANDGRIDYLWLNVGARLRAVRAEEIFTPERYGRVSDHTGYWVEFELR